MNRNSGEVQASAVQGILNQWALDNHPTLHSPGSGAVHQGPQGASRGPSLTHNALWHPLFPPRPGLQTPSSVLHQFPHPSKPPHPGLSSGFASWRSKLRWQETKNFEPQLMKLKRVAHFMQVRLPLYLLIYVCIYIYINIYIYIYNDYDKETQVTITIFLP